RRLLCPRRSGDPAACRAGWIRRGRSTVAHGPRDCGSRREGACVKNAIVTGASSGIGEATARLLAGEGWKLLLVARREDRLSQLASDIGASYLALDLTDEDAPGQVRAGVDRELDGRLDLLVNNAGASWRARFGDQEKGGYENVRKTMEIN